MVGTQKEGSKLEAEDARFSLTQSANHDDISGRVISTGWKERMAKKRVRYYGLRTYCILYVLALNERTYCMLSELYYFVA